MDQTEMFCKVPGGTGRVKKPRIEKASDEIIMGVLILAYSRILKDEPFSMNDTVACFELPNSLIQAMKVAGVVDRPKGTKKWVWLLDSGPTMAVVDMVRAGIKKYNEAKRKSNKPDEPKPIEAVEIQSEIQSVCFATLQRVEAKINAITKAIGVE